MSAEAAVHTTVVIFINGHKYEVESGSLTGKQIKQIGNVPDNETLYLKVHGDERRIADDELVELKNGDHFVSAPDGGVSVMPTFDDELAALGRVYTGARLLEVPGRRLVRLPMLTLTSADWSPNPVRGLLLCENWPNQRPQLLVGGDLHRNGAEPANFSRQYQAGESWFGYSFQAPWDPARPGLVPAVRGWLARFDGRA